MQDIVVTGSIAYDYLMRFPGNFTDHFIDGKLHSVSLSFLVDDMTKHWGGNGANIAYTLALLGFKPHLFGAAGRDFGDYRVHLESAGVDCSMVQQHDEVFTASFFVNTDLDHNQIASFYTGAMALAKNYSLADVGAGKPDMVVISPNDPAAMLQLAEECRQRDIPFMADPSQQIPRLDGEQLRQFITGAAFLVVNEYESEIIANKTGLTPDTIRNQVGTLIVTHGAKGAMIYNDTATEVPVFATDNLLDPTGVGDAFRAGWLRGLAANLPLELSARMGALSATYAMEHVGTQSHTYTLPEFIARFRTQFDDDGALDTLL